MGKFRITNKGLYWGLIITFIVLYLFVGFVSTLHSITFFNLANTTSLAILLGIAYEIGQASVLFSILMTKNRDRFLPWALMFLLTALQVSANVFASFKYIAKSGSDDWIYWQKSILIGVQAQNAEMYQVIISWIAGALLPIVALGMTALVAQNIKLMTEEGDEIKASIPDEEVDEVIENEVQKRFSEYLAATQSGEKKDSAIEDAEEVAETPVEEVVDEKKPLKRERGWHLRKEYVDTNGDVYSFGKFTGETVLLEDETPKKEKELLSDRDVEVPKKEADPIENIEKLFKPSRGDEVIELIKKQSTDKDKGTPITSSADNEMSHQAHLVPPEIHTPYIDGGVEVIDAKAIPSDKTSKNK